MQEAGRGGSQSSEPASPQRTGRAGKRGFGTRQEVSRLNAPRPHRRCRAADAGGKVISSQPPSDRRQGRRGMGITPANQPRRFHILLRRKIAILVVAGLWLFGADLLGSSSATASAARKSSSSGTGSAVSSANTRASSTKKKRTSSRKRGRRYNPWRISSHGEPTANDNPAGEDPMVREAAI